MQLLVILFIIIGDSTFCSASSELVFFSVLHYTYMKMIGFKDQGGKL